MELGTNHNRVLKMLKKLSKPVTESRLLIEVKGKYPCQKPAKYDLAFEELVEADVIRIHPETKIVSLVETVAA
jgi:hypothetical protein